MVAVFLLAGCLSYSNSAMNPVLYAFLSENFKKSFLKACTCATGRDANAALHVENSAFPRKRTLLGGSGFRRNRNGGGDKEKRDRDGKKDGDGKVSVPFFYVGFNTCVHIMKLLVRTNFFSSQDIRGDHDRRGKNGGGGGGAQNYGSSDRKKETRALLSVDSAAGGRGGGAGGGSSSFDLHSTCTSRSQVRKVRHMCNVGSV